MVAANGEPSGSRVESTGLVIACVWGGLEVKPPRMSVTAAAGLFGLDGPDGVESGCRGDEYGLTGGNEDRGQAAFGVTYFIGPPAVIDLALGDCGGEITCGGVAEQSFADVAFSRDDLTCCW